MAKEKKGLGTGLSALFGDDNLDEAENIKTLSLSKIEPKADQPRTKFDEEALQTLAESIKQHGLIQPITVRLLDSGYYQIIAGERRWRASKLAGLSEVPVNIIEADDRKASELALVENLQREDLNPIEEARGYRSLMNDYGLTQEETAKSVGRSRPAVANSLRLLNLSENVLKLVETNQLSAGHARALIPIEDEKLQYNTAYEVIEKSLSVRKTEQLVNAVINGRDKKSAKDKEIDKPFVDYIKVLSDELTKSLGRKVTINDGKRTGRIELEYCGDEDRENLVDALRRLK